MLYLLVKESAGCRVARVIGQGIKRVLGHNLVARTCRSLSQNHETSTNAESRPFKVMPAQILATYEDEYETLTSTALDYEVAFKHLVVNYAKQLRFVGQSSQVTGETQ